MKRIAYPEYEAPKAAIFELYTEQNFATSTYGEEGEAGDELGDDIVFGSF